jgi:hypothetical protein
MEEANIKRKGRPPGSRRKGLKKWEPVTWKPIYEQFVAMNVAGKSNIEIAGFFNYTPQQVSNILTCDKAIEIKAGIIQRIRNKIGDTLDDRVAGIVDKTISRTTDLLSNEEAFIKNPLGVIKIGLAVGAATGHIKSNSPKDNPDNSPNGPTINNLNFIGNSGIALLVEAIRRSDEARLLNAGS